MRINRIELKNFRSHVHTKIEGLERVNYFLGLNGAGKSSIVDAISYALSGVCRGTDEGGRNAELLINQGDEISAKQFVISLETSAGNIVRMGPGGGPKSNAQQQVNRMLKLSPIVSRALVDVTHFFGLGATEQKAILERVLELEIKESVIEGACRPEDWQVAKMTVPMPIENYSDLLAAEKILRAARAGLKSMAPASPSKPDLASLAPDVQKMGLGEAQGMLTQVKAKLRSLYEEKGRQEALVTNASDRRAKMEAEVEKATVTVASLTSAIDKIGDPRPGLMKVIGEIATLSNEVGQASKTKSSEDAERSEAFIVMLEAAKERCPVCLGEMSAKRRLAAINAHRGTADLTRRQTDLSGTTKFEQLQAAKNRLATLELDADKASAIKADVRRWSEHILNLKSQLSSVVIQQSPGPPPELLERIKKGEVVAEQIGRLIAILEGHEKAVADHHSQAKHIEAMERLVEVFGPKGIRVKLIEEKLATFLELANRFMVVFGFGVKIGLDPFMVYVNGRRTIMLSETERLRAGVAFQMALSDRAGLKFVAIDQVDSLDFRSRPALETIISAAEDFQFLLFGTPKNDPETMSWPTAAAHAFFHVANNASGSRVERKG